MMRIDAIPHVGRATGRRALAEAFRQSTPARLAAGLLLTLTLLAAFAPWLAPQDPFDPAASQLREAERPPAWLDAGDGPRFVLGTDEQGRDLLSLVLHGARLSLVVGAMSVLLALLLGLPIGLVAGFARGPLDAVLMRVVDVQLSIPPMLLALAIDGVVTSALPPERRAQAMLPLVILAIGLSQWVVFARTVRGAVLVEREKEYVAAARALGAKTTTILRRHVLPNVLAPVIVLATVQMASAVLDRGDAVVSRRRAAADLALARDPDRGRQRLPTGGPLVDDGLPGPGAGPAGRLHDRPGRLDARRAQSQAWRHRWLVAPPPTSRAPRATSGA